jgi:multisubunit Na+/H+ antiporter MnhF subunit
MENFSDLFNKRHMPQLVLAFLFVIYLVLGYKMPDNVASAVDTTVGKIIVVLAALMLFAYSHPFLGVLALIVAYQIINSASTKTGLAALEQYYPTEQQKWSPFTPAHQFPYTLEQEVVKTMTTQKFNSSYVKAPFRPVLDDTHDASPLTSV